MKKQKRVRKKEICFVIMPYGGWFDEYYENIYRPAIESAGLEPHRADDLYAPNNVVSDIWEYTKKAQIVLADLTGKNPNVLYELGLAHAIAKPVILLAELEEDIPFDMRAIRIIKYDKNKYDWGENLKQSVKKSIKEIIKNPQDSIPVPFLKINKQSQQTSLTKTDKAIIELRQDIKLIKKEFTYGSTDIEIWQIDDLILDVRKHVVKRDHKEIYLTRKEFTLLEYLMKNEGIVLSRGMIMEHVWDVNADPFSNAIESHILSLRRKIDSSRKTKLIRTVPGRGYTISSN